MSRPRIRIFAGPNGSGKSTLNNQVQAHLLKNYINPDLIEAKIKKNGAFDFGDFNLQAHKEQAIPFLRSHRVFVGNPTSLAMIDDLEIAGELLVFPSGQVDSYIASALSDFIRVTLLEDRASFSFETVMSDVSKVDFLRAARHAGYRVYLYYVATVDPEINVTRVAYRARNKGHDVPTAKIIPRYWRSLGLLSEAILVSDRAYIFDNSEDGKKGASLISEITDGEDIEIKTDSQPAWFSEFVLQKLL